MQEKKVKDLMDAGEVALQKYKKFLETMKVWTRYGILLLAFGPSMPGSLLRYLT